MRFCDACSTMVSSMTVKSDTEGDHIPGLLVYRPYAPLIFANARHVMTRIKSLVHAAGPHLQWLVLDAQAVTAAEHFVQMQRDLLARGVTLKFADCPRPLREQLDNLLTLGLSGPQEYVVSVGKAVQAFESRRRLPVNPGERTAR